MVCWTDGKLLMRLGGYLIGHLTGRNALPKSIFAWTRHPRALTCSNAVAHTTLTLCLWLRARSSSPESPDPSRHFDRSSALTVCRLNCYCTTGFRLVCSSRIGVHMVSLIWFAQLSWVHKSSTVCELLGHCRYQKQQQQKTREKETCSSVKIWFGQHFACSFAFIYNLYLICWSSAYNLLLHKKKEKEKETFLKDCDSVYFKYLLPAVLFSCENVLDWHAH